MLRTFLIAGVLAASAGLAHAQAADPARVDVAVKVDLSQPKAARAALRAAARQACYSAGGDLLDNPVTCYDLALSDALEKLDQAEHARLARVAAQPQQTASRTGA